MGRSIIVVESPAKARTIKKYLGEDFDVVASMGHIKDLPKSRLGVDLENEFEPNYIEIRDKKKIIKEIKEKANEAEGIYLASDPDREGEAIAWHIKDIVGKDKGRVKRVLFREITKKGVEQGMGNPRDLDRNLYDAQVARRVLDRLVGYRLSPLLWTKVQKRLSAGRVQSVALKLICDREKEIRGFTPVEYWSITGLFKGKNPPDFKARLTEKGGKKLEVKREEEAEKIISELRGNTYSVFSVKKKLRKRNPRAPFITSTLQQEAWTRLKFSADRTMRVAQSLYEGVDLGEGELTGLITYMRTDSVRVSMDAISQARSHVEGRFGKEFLPARPRTYKNKKGSQDAHEAIRPTDVENSPKKVKGSLTADQYRLYRLVWERFLASQMASASFEQVTVDIHGGDYCFRATGQTPLFDGFLILYKDVKEKKGDEEDVKLPTLEEKDPLKLLSLDPKQHFTQPPPRFSESSLIKVLEEKGIGRPSTYAAIIRTIKGRDYVNIEKARFFPTELGMIVSDLLAENFPVIMDLTFTARLEEELDRVEEGKIEWKQAVGSFYIPFAEALENARENMEKVKDKLNATGIPCEKCDGELVIRVGKNGRFLACNRYPDCRNTKNFQEDDGKIVILEDLPSGEACVKCGEEMVIRVWNGARYLKCSKTPGCDGSAPYSLGVSCPSCEKGDLVEKASRRGKVFYSCSQYPACRFATWREPVEKECPLCGNRIMLKKYLRSRGTEFVCAVKGCKGKIRGDGSENG